MNRQAWWQRVLTGVVAASAAAILVSSALPHHHGAAAASHSDQACRVCKLQQAFSATPPSDGPTFEPSEALRSALMTAHEAPRIFAHATPQAPRAPPQSS